MDTVSDLVTVVLVRGSVSGGGALPAEPEVLHVHDLLQQRRHLGKYIL